MVTFEIKHRITYVHVEGDIFAVATAELKNAFQESWQKKVFKVVVDLEESNLINSSGIGVIVGALKTCRESAADGDLVIVNPSSYIRRTLRIMGVDKFIPAKDSIEEAAEYLRSKKETDDASFF